MPGGAYVQDGHCHVSGHKKMEEEKQPQMPFDFLLLGQ